ncbi:hypothetical protein CMV_024469 [Castanea mollissima]|uniref:Uncharacterized protein n=1 Tax=Castanea mollissima TaxID=60419 RepID=A0A8J4QES5_9ROSI|nr:hypothetical protein CMV_024469 [Castanea mollissima]
MKSQKEQEDFKWEEESRFFEAQSKLLKGCQQEQGTIGKNFSHPIKNKRISNGKKGGKKKAVPAGNKGRLVKTSHILGKFSFTEEITVKSAGVAAMNIVSKKLKKKH